MSDEYFILNRCEKRIIKSKKSLVCSQKFAFQSRLGPLDCRKSKKTLAI